MNSFWWLHKILNYHKCRIRTSNCSVEAFYQISSDPSNLFGENNAIAVSNYEGTGYFAFYEMKSGDNRILVVGMSLLYDHQLHQATSISSNYIPMNMRSDSTGIQYLLAYANNIFQLIIVRNTIYFTPSNSWLNPFNLV